MHTYIYRYRYIYIYAYKSKRLHMLAHDTPHVGPGERGQELSYDAFWMKVGQLFSTKLVAPAFFRISSTLPYPSILWVSERRSDSSGKGFAKV